MPTLPKKNRQNGQGRDTLPNSAKWVSANCPIFDITNTPKKLSLSVIRQCFEIVHFSGTMVTPDNNSQVLPTKEQALFKKLMVSFCYKCIKCFSKFFFIALYGIINLLIQKMEICFRNDFGDECLVPESPLFLSCMNERLVAIVEPIVDHLVMRCRKMVKKIWLFRNAASRSNTKQDWNLWSKFYRIPNVPSMEVSLMAK